MSRRMTVAAAGVIAMAAGVGESVAAAPLAGFAANLDTGYAHSSPAGGNQWFIGGAVAGPLGFPNLNFQVDAGYSNTWATGLNQRAGSVGGSLFWAGADGRVGIRGEYDSISHGGNAGLGIAFGEAYFGIVTGMLKGGYINTSGSGLSGRGGTVGAGAAIYPMPNLAITPAIDYSNLVTGQACRTCGRLGETVTRPSITAEFLLGDPFSGIPLFGGGLSVFGGYAYDQFKTLGVKSHANEWMIGLRLYTGGGTLMDQHRNGALNPFLTHTVF